VEAPASARLEVAVRTLIGAVIAIAALLLLISLVSQTITHTYDLNPERFTIQFVNVDAERNLPTSFQSGLFLACGFALAAIAAVSYLSGDRWRRHWAVLSFVFMVLAWDEITEIHEHLIHIMEPLGFSGVFRFAWIIPAAIAVGIFSLAMLPFIRAVPPALRTRFVLAAAIFIGGILSLEAIGGWYYERINEDINLPYVLLTTFEEALEMTALILFLHTLLTHLTTILPPAGLRLRGADGQLWVERADGDDSRK
jgi:hypothetical protein